MRKLILTSWLVLMVVGPSPAAARYVFFEAWPSACSGPPYPFVSPLEVGIHVPGESGLKEACRLLVNVKQAAPPLPVRMTSSNRGGGDYAVESFFDIFYTGQPGDYPAESFFDIFVEVDPGEGMPAGIAQVVPSVKHLADSFFDIFIEVSFEGGDREILQLHGEPLAGVKFGNVRLGGVSTAESFFDLFVEVDVPGIAPPDFSSPLMTIEMRGVHVPGAPAVARALLYATADGGGLPSDYAIYCDLWTPPDANAFYYETGYSTPGGVCSLHGILLPTGLAIEEIERISELGGGGRCVSRASYDEKGRILRVDQASKDAAEPNDVIVFEYDEKERLTKVTLYKEQVEEEKKKKEIELTGYCDNCPASLRKMPEKCTYSDYTEDFKEYVVYASGDTQGRLISVTSNRRHHDHIGNFIFAYDPNGRITMMSSGKDDDCDGYYERPLLNAMMRYDEDEKLKAIRDTISDSNILEWERISVSDTEAREEIRKKCIFGNPAVDTVTWTVTDAADSNIYSGKADITVPDGGGSVTVRNWNWWGDADPPSMVSTDVNWTTLDSNLGDTRIGNRVILPILRPDGKLAATLDAKEMSICDYSSKGRQGGIVFASNGSRRMELHFYDMNVDGSIAAMLTMDEYGNSILGFGGTGVELARYNFFEAWPARIPPAPADLPSPLGGPVVSRYNFFEAWPAKLPDLPQVAADARNNFLEAWPSAWGVQPYVPIYSETGDGMPYIAGAVTPGGAYCCFQYSSSGEYDIEAIVRMNSVDMPGCTEDIPGDLDGDCRLDFRDLGMMALRWLDCTLEYQEACK